VIRLVFVFIVISPLGPETENARKKLRAQADSAACFFHPDYTVGFGIQPKSAKRLAGSSLARITAGGDFHPALKQTLCIFHYYSLRACVCQANFADKAPGTRYNKKTEFHVKI
jgi:hypothetical protein